MQRKVENNGTKSDVDQAPTGEKVMDADRQSKSREQLVREAAYRRYEERGAGHGRDEEDWLEAEREVRPPEGN